MVVASVEMSALSSSRVIHSGEMSSANTRPNFGLGGGNKKRRAANGGAAAPKQDAWRRHLEEGSARAAREIKGKLAATHTVVLRTEQPLRCDQCNHIKYHRDMVPFSCTTSKRWSSNDDGGASAASAAEHHEFCTQCVLAMLKQQWDTRQGLECTESLALMERLERSCKHRFMFVICPVCRSPNVITQSTKFCDSFARERIDSRLQFTVHVGATRMLGENQYVEELFENQRRPFFGAFSAANLFVTDFRGTYSTQEASEIEDVKKTFEKPNSSWAWVDNWSPDLRGAPNSGWRYATRWEEMDDGKWSTIVSLFAFVRRRRMLRTRVRLNNEVCADLVNLYRQDDSDDDGAGDDRVASALSQAGAPRQKHVDPAAAVA
jgi:hypothetical protein